MTNVIHAEFGHHIVTQDPPLVPYPWGAKRMHSFRQGRDWDGEEWRILRLGAHNWARENGWCVRTWHEPVGDGRCSRFIVSFIWQRLDVNRDGTRTNRGPYDPQNHSRRAVA